MMARCNSAPLNPKGWTFEKVMRADVGGSAATAHRDAQIADRRTLGG